MEYIQRKIFQRLDISVPFGNAIVLVFLITQFFDGASTYIGLRWGIITEINPLICWLISVTGISIAIAVAKIVAIGLGIMLHLINAHNALAICTVTCLFFLALPWIYLFFCIVTDSVLLI